MEEQGKELDVALGKCREFMTFAANSSPVQNAVVSSSKAPEVPVQPSLQEILAHAPSFKSMKEFDEYEKKQCTRSKKAKKESVHLPVELRGKETTNVQVFPEVSHNPLNDNGEPLFIEENVKAFPNSLSITNPEHSHARDYKDLIKSLNLVVNEGYLNDPSLDITYTDYKSQVGSEEPLDWGTPSTQDDESYDSLSEELATMAGINHLSLTPAPSLRLSQAPSTRSRESERRSSLGKTIRITILIAMHTMTMATIG